MFACVKAKHEGKKNKQQLNYDAGYKRTKLLVTVTKQLYF